MSGLGSDNSEKGKGRGRLLSILRQASSGQGSEPEVQSSGRNEHDRSDSGIRTTADTSSPQLGKGRGELLKVLSSMSINKSEVISVSSSDDVRSTSDVCLMGAGRAKLFSALGRTDVPVTPLSVRLPAHLARTRGLGSQKEEKVAEIAAVPLVPLTETAFVETEESDTEKEVVSKRGTHGTQINCLTNYIRMRCDPKMGVFEYEIRFEPNVHCLKLRYHLLNQHREVLGGTAKSFDGVVLFLPFRLPNNITKLTSTNKNDNSSVNLSVIYKRQKKLIDCMQLYNIMFERIMRILEFVRYGRKNFDPTEPKLIPQHKLEVWPGYVTAVDEYEDGIMLCLDVTHRVLCQTTVLEKLTHAYRSAKGNMQDFQTNVVKALLGAVVLTRYNNKTYRIDDVDFEANPMNTFKTRDREITYVEYYKSHYNIEIRDLKQPLLISRKERRVVGKDAPETLTFCLIPEISFLTGLTDELRADFKVMRDIATFTRITPNQRVQALQKFCKRVNSVPQAREVLTNWGLTLEESPLPIQCRQLGEEMVYFAKNKSFSAGRNADFGKYATANELLHVIHLTNWLIVHTRNDQRVAKAFMECMERNSKPMGITVCSPQMIVLDNDKTETYVQALRSSLTAQTQIVVTICPTSRDDRYAAIKKVCCAELPVPSQVINSRTLSNEAKNRAIVQKIALQMNCKMGGTLWSIKIPFTNVMICGIDTYHEVGMPNKGNSVSAFVASLNNTYTQWYSKAVIQNKKEELIHGLVDSFQKALHSYQNMNGKLPERIIIYRDGVGDGQLNICKEYELPQLQKACAFIGPGYNPEFTFVVVQKRINTRIFALGGGNNLENPNPGCVLDHTVTRRFLYDFFLVPQSVRQGTVTPTHMIVVHDTANLAPDVLQRLSYKLCFLYYNWPGTVRVPACCQYAHKLANLVGQSIKREPSEKLAEKLFYL